MPSKDPINAKANRWLSGQERPSATGHPVRGATGSKTALSAQLLRLARRLGKDPVELAEKFPADTLRRLKFPVIETEHEDGSRSFKDDRQIAEGVRALRHT